MRIALIDDQMEIRYAVKKILEQNSYDVVTYCGDEDGLIEELIEQKFDFLLVDARLEEGRSGIDILRSLGEQKALPPALLVTGYTTPSNIIEASRLGVKEVLQKPFEPHELIELIEQHALKKKRVNKDLIVFDAQSENFIGSFETMKDIYKKVGIASNNDLNVLLVGETGSGKELIASMIHRFSPRSSEPFVALNCAAIPADLFESQLFGHEKGSFTGADRQHIGFAEEAKGGTLFLDEVGELPLAQQSKLLRFLETRTFRRLGGIKEISFSGRIVAATNISFTDSIQKGDFREDLYYRLGMLSISVPPLRERQGDLNALVKHFILQANKELHTEVQSISKNALEELVKHSWPGNIRELRNTIYNAVMQTSNQQIGINDIYINPIIQKSVKNELDGIFDAMLKEQGLADAHKVYEEIEKKFLVHLWEKSNRNITHLAQALRVSRNTLKAKLKGFEIL